MHHPNIQTHRSLSESVDGGGTTAAMSSFSILHHVRNENDHAREFWQTQLILEPIPIPYQRRLQCIHIFESTTTCVVSIRGYSWIGGASEWLVHFVLLFFEGHADVLTLNLLALTK